MIAQIMIKAFQGQRERKGLNRSREQIGALSLSERAAHAVNLAKAGMPQGAMAENLKGMLEKIVNLKNSRVSVSKVRPLHTPRSKYERFM